MGQARRRIKAAGWGEGHGILMHAAPPDLVLGCRVGAFAEGGGASTGGRMSAWGPPALALRLLLWVLRSDGIVAQGGIAAGKSLL